jgi:hypothetical protein
MFPAAPLSALKLHNICSITNNPQNKHIDDATTYMSAKKDFVQNFKRHTG